MGRSVILSNNSLAVGLNEEGLVHDFYYPYVGLDNLTTARNSSHRIGIWVDGSFVWLDDTSWQRHIDFRSDSLVTNAVYEHEKLGITVRFEDFIDAKYDVFIRRALIINHRSEKREVRLFFHQIFQISAGGRGDTALFVPEENYILDYKGRCCLLIYAEDDNGVPFDQFATGNCGTEGKEGTFRDAEDGELSGNPVEHAGVDSVIRLKLDVPANGERRADYWVVAGDSQYEIERIHQKIKSSAAERQSFTVDWWREWMAPANKTIDTLPEAYRAIARKSLLVIKAHTDRRGGILASCDSSIYNYGRDYYSYVWPRDGAYAIWPLIRCGLYDEAKKFFIFCRDIMNKNGYMMHKYQPDRAIGSTWHPLVHGKHAELAIQEDETAIMVYMLGEYLDYSGDEEFVREMYASFVRPCAEFMVHFVDEPTGLPHASYDLWEEKFVTSTYTTALVYQSLLVAAKLADKYDDGHVSSKWRNSAEHLKKNAGIFYEPNRGVYRKGFLMKPEGDLSFDDTLDISSVYAMFMFDYEPNHENLQHSVAVVERELLDQAPSGGSPRYEYDNYFSSDPPYKGNPWFVTTLWMAQYYIRRNQLDKAKAIIDWTLSHTSESGILPEQIHPKNGDHAGVAPLVWSHAELVNTLLDLYAQ